MRGRGIVSALAAAALCLLALLAVAACSAPRDPAAARGAARIRGTGTEVRTPGGLARCERRLEHSARPLLAVAGASFTAGTGPGDPRLSWAVLLARALRWNAVVVGVPGAGYTRAGRSGQGPALRVLGREDLAALRPELVILQFGFDDIGVAPGLERQRVAATLRHVRALAPRARIALLTVFTAAAAGRRQIAALQTDAAIVSAAAPFRHVVVMNPLALGWTFQRAVRGGLHPSAAGDAQIAALAAGMLRADGVLPAPAAGGAPLICVRGITARPTRPD